MRLLLTAAFSAFFQVVNTRHQRMLTLFQLYVF